VSEAPGDAQALVGLLADLRRFKVVAALVLGAATTAEIAAAAGLDDAEVRRALERLSRGGLVGVDPGGELVLRHERFAASARAASQEKRLVEVSPEELGATSEQAAVLRNFMTGGRLREVPAVASKRRVVLDFLACRFEPGVRYPERDVNEILGAFHPDVAALRRYLVDEGFLERDQGVYWRAGGTVEVT